MTSCNWRWWGSCYGRFHWWLHTWPVTRRVSLICRLFRYCSVCLALYAVWACCRYSITWRFNTWESWLRRTGRSNYRTGHVRAGQLAWPATCWSWRRCRVRSWRPHVVACTGTGLCRGLVLLQRTCSIHVFRLIPAVHWMQHTRIITADRTCYKRSAKLMLGNGRSCCEHRQPLISSTTVHPLSTDQMQVHEHRCPTN